MKRLSRKKSNRVSLRRKHNLVKKASEAKKKLRKEARRMSRQGIKKQEKKDPGIPNLCPQKKELLEELQAQKKLEHEYNLEVRKRQKEQKTTQEFQELRNPEPVYKQNHSLEALITSSDIIFEVLDSRDPYPSPHLKLLIGTKPHVFIINKADLIDSTQLDL